MSFRHLFRNPPAAYRPVPFWFWNDDMEPQEIVHQVQEMADKGVGGVFICARQGLGIAYLSEEWFERVAIAVEAAQQYGLDAWLYDEYPYPSGMSGGEVTLQHPDARQRQLLHRSITVTGPHVLSYDLPWAKVLFARTILLDVATPTAQGSSTRDLTSSIGIVPAEAVFQSTGLTTYTRKRFFTARPQKRLVWNVPPGRWLITIFLEEEIDDFKYFGTYVDPCHAEAIQTFLATTYEPYAQRFHRHFGQTIKGFFTDEVGLLGNIPWSSRLPDFFRDHYAYELIDHLPALLHPQGEKTAQIRYHFFQSVHQLLTTTYHQQISTWCHDHNLLYISEVPSTRMTTQRYSHIPGGDSAHEKVGRSLEWILDRYGASLRADPKIASSLAAQFGREQAMIECFHSVGWSMTLQDAKWMIDRLAALGINLLVFHAFFSSISNLRKHDAPPSQFLQNPYWPYFRQLTDYVGRLCYAMSQGRAEVSIAVVHPVTTFWAHMGNPFHNFKYCGDDAAEEQALERLKQDWLYLCKHLLLQQVDYDHLDPELLAESSIEDGQLVSGHARYKVLILPPMTNLSSAAWSQVKAFLQAGGRVISIGLLPYEQIDDEQRIEQEMLTWFGLTDSPQQHYWQTTNEQVQDVQWTQGMYAAYFIPSAGDAQRVNTMQCLLTLLQQCASPAVTLEAIEGNRNSFLMRQRSLPDGSQLIFITHQEGAEKALRLHLPQRPARQRVELLDMRSGTATALLAEQTTAGWSIPLSFAPYESHLLHCSYHEEAEETATASPASRTQQPWQFTLDIQQPWQLTARQENILRLGSFRFTLDPDNTGVQKRWHEERVSQSWPLVEARPFINQCADSATHQTFPLQFRQTFGTPVRSSIAYPVHCWYQTLFTVEDIPLTCQLVMDEQAIGDNYTLYLNGKAISPDSFALASPHGYQQQVCAIHHLLQQGSNLLAIHVEVRRDEDGVRDPLYLSGPFGVTFDAAGVPSIGKPPLTSTPGRNIQPGYPYYAGTLCFTREIAIEELPEQQQFAVQLQGWDEQIHDCVEIIVNAHSLGVCCWSPYHWEGERSILHKGANTIEIRMTNTLHNMLEGAYFDEPSHQVVPFASHAAQ